MSFSSESKDGLHLKKGLFCLICKINIICIPLSFLNRIVIVQTILNSVTWNIILDLQTSEVEAKTSTDFEELDLELIIFQNGKLTFYFINFCVVLYKHVGLKPRDNDHDY